MEQPPINALSDHDALTTLVETVKNLKDSQDRFHVEMKESFKDLKDNYASRLENIEKAQALADRVFVAKEAQDKINIALEGRIRKLENKLLYYLGGGGVIAVLIIACWQLLLAYFSKH